MFLHCRPQHYKEAHAQWAAFHVGNESVPYRKARTFPGNLRSRLAFLRNCVLYHHRHIWCAYPVFFFHSTLADHVVISHQGLYGVFVIKFNLQVAAFRRKHLAAYPIAEAVVLATLTAFFGYFNRFLRIDMTESLEILFRECEGGGDHENLCQYENPFSSLPIQVLTWLWF